MNEKLISSFELKKTKIEGEYESYPFFTAIKKGIQTYRNWYKDIKVNGMFYHLIARITIFLNAKWYNHMFKHSHKYYVFAGVKSQPEKLLQ